MPELTPVSAAYEPVLVVEQYIRGQRSWESTDTLLRADHDLDLTAPERDELVGLREIAVDATGPLEDAVVEAARTRVLAMIEERA